MAFLALLGVALGMLLVGEQKLGAHIARHKDLLPRRTLNAAIVIAGLLVGMSACRYGTLISQGFVNTHVNAYVMQATVAESLFYVFANQGRFAAILLLGFICHSSSDKTRPVILKALIVYTILLECVLI